MEATASTDDATANPIRAATPRRDRAQRRVRWLIAGIWVIGLVSVGLTPHLDAAPFLDLHLNWLLTAAAFYFAEIFVVHLQFRQDAHTFSMSEVPLVLGLLSLSPIGLIAAQVVGSGVALAANRRQRPAKLLFNLGQLTVQAVVAIAIFGALTDGAPPGFDAGLVVSLIVCTQAALFVGHAAVLAAIRASGGTESVSETTRVLAVSSAGTAGATILGIVAAIVLSSAPRVWWLGFAPIVLVFVTYRSFISQARDKDRIEALFDASNALHENSELEKIIVTAAEQALQLVKAATAAVIVLPMGNASSGLVTVVDLSGHRRESPTFAALTDRPSFMDPPENRVLTKQTELNDIGYLLGNRIEVHDAVIGVLTLEGNPVGVLVGVNRLGDVSAFTTDDARVLATLARQLSTALENGRLMHNLTEVSTLKEQLEKTLESKSRLVASVSHELRTPLTGVIGLASVVRDGMSDDFDTDARAMLDMIVEQGNELSNIIDDLLAHAKSEAGTLKLSPMAFDLGDEATTVATTQHLDELHRTGSVVVIADPLRVRQILRNLVTNARRYGGPAIRLEIGSRNGFGLAAVIDDGAGVPDEFEAAIFEPYRSAHSPMSQPGSVGLGLALSRTMARMMGGELTYSHRFGETRFELTLPLSTVTHSRG